MNQNAAKSIFAYYSTGHVDYYFYYPIVNDENLRKKRVDGNYEETRFYLNIPVQNVLISGNKNTNQL